MRIEAEAVEAQPLASFGVANPHRRAAFAAGGHAGLDDEPEGPEFEEIVRLFIENDVVFDATITAYGYYGDRERFYDHWTDERRFFTPYARKITEGERQRIEARGVSVARISA